MLLHQLVHPSPGRYVQGERGQVLEADLNEMSISAPVWRFTHRGKILASLSESKIKTKSPNTNILVNYDTVW